MVTVIGKGLFLPFFFLKEKKISCSTGPEVQEATCKTLQRMKRK